MNSKAVRWLAIAFAVWFVVKDPSGAATAAHKVLAFAGQAATSLAGFITSI